MWETTNEKPSERIQFALDALIKAEQPGSCVTPRMGTWFYTPDDSNHCFACLGGMAALEKTGLTVQEHVRFREQFYNELHVYEDTLDDARDGNLEEMFAKMGLSRKIGVKFDRELVQYWEDPEQFKTDLRTLISDLQSAGY
ncbi:hypothetical protein [Spirosoma terrae]|uniref:Uncharacterized protein n=1 Tax=Spirosoma terrae TaxID=1968276 RepID=A0A6L9L5M0_9BACT|nr:hypothetical protein [Spirosoma terrae]NDU95784.1 hypothetical protein [Spirosoma terrae]